MPFISVNKKSIRIELSPLEQEEYRKRMRYIMEQQERKAREKEEYIKNLKTCPVCHMKCTDSGFCKVCGRDCRDEIVKGPKVKVITNKDSDWGIIKVKI